MALTNSFYEAVNSGNVRRVRIMMKNSLLVDPTFVEFHEMEKAASSMDGLYDEHDGKELVEDRSQWNDDYMDRVMVKVLSNFSHERLDHLKEVVRYLRPVKKTVSTRTHEANGRNHYDNTSKRSYQAEKRHCQENGDYRGAKISAGAVVGAAVGGVVATVAGATVSGIVGGIAAGTVVGGVAASMIINGGK